MNGGKIDEHIVVCMPMYSDLHVASAISTFSSLGQLGMFFSKMSFVQKSGTYIHIARREIVKDVLEKDKQMPVDYLMWIDSDQVFSVKNIVDLVNSAKENGADIMSALYFTKQHPFWPVYYYKTEGGFSKGEDVPENEIIDVDAAGFGFLLMKMDVVKKLLEKYKIEDLFAYKDTKTGEAVGEDFLFCIRAKEEGFKVKVNTGISVGHAGGIVTKDIYYAMKEYEKRGGRKGK